MGANDLNFDLPGDESFIPNPEQVSALQALMPAEPFALVPKADDRAAWDPWRDTSHGQHVLTKAREFAHQPFPAYSNDAWLASLEQQDAPAIYGALRDTRLRQTVFLMAEAIFDEGEFIPFIDAEARLITKVNTWVHPDNDRRRLNFDGKIVDSDLASLHFCENLALTDFVLGSRLPADWRSLVREQINRRLFAPLRQRIETGRFLDWWIMAKHNWSSACLSCTAHTATALLPDAADRAWWLAFAHAHVLNFRDSFTDDGFCTEGVGYWGYGFGRFIVLRELLRMATGNVIDLLAEPKMARAARFPTRAEIQPGVYPAFADAHLDVKPPLWASLWVDNQRGTPPLPVEPITADMDPMAESGPTIGIGGLMWMFHTRDPHQPMKLRAPRALRNWFEQSTLLICRPDTSTQRQFSATFLGGNNGVNHNHNDLGTFTVVLDGRTLVMDPGLEAYSYRTFSEQRYESQLLNSYGHPVPRVAGQLQSAGSEWQARVTQKEFTAATDLMVLDLRGAYDVPGLRQLEREFLYDRRGDGSLTITDRVEFAAAAAFESALITPGKVSIEANKVTMADEHATLVAEITIEGAELELDTDTINQPPHPTRVALRCAGEVTAAIIRTVIRPT